ncbi:hypothetical protein CEE69_14550 [Rhodopirellula bahusiensis]|uniref:Uncharacterized protein n=1 Tax=Rhodopirellula bahusiensis TaxID=2014065 RepID=A0A2G1W6H3_9BACT|nr:hypothetical protein CEE69_14550 [Rhodopirellula bahusiensis]
MHRKNLLLWVTFLRGTVSQAGVCGNLNHVIQFSHDWSVVFEIFSNAIHHESRNASVGSGVAAPLSGCLGRIVLAGRLPNSFGSKQLF